MASPGRGSAAARVLSFCAVLTLATTAVLGATPGPVVLKRVATAHDDSVTRAGQVLRRYADSLRGRSGKLLMRLVSRDHGSFAVPLFERLFGDSALLHPGIYAPPDTAFASLRFISMLPFAHKQDGRVGRYRIGFWPAERGVPVGTGAYANPDGFIEVTPKNEETRISAHFRLRDFLTHDQSDVWPKYLVLREALVDKLELVIDELERRGVPVEHMAVMSGFRTPQYNAAGGETGGRANLSRHMYGDAADVFVDNDGDGRMDDLNHDGRVDHRDAQVILDAVNAVERAHPDLIGGVGVYRATPSHGPFAHVDARGRRARWGLI